jgi:hypothetical protein
MREKKFKISSDDIQDLIKGFGGCIAPDKITVEVELIDYMYRAVPRNNIDSGWRFLSGTETQEYIDNPDNLAIYDINTIANYDRAIIFYLDLPIGTHLERSKGTDTFTQIS